MAVKTEDKRRRILSAALKLHSGWGARPPASHKASLPQRLDVRH